jgi:3-methyladenine DNA glycosylase/8-oxoguanine DNA glycosylase
MPHSLPDWTATAHLELARRDPVMRLLVESHGPIRLRDPLPSGFHSVVRSIAFQQLNGRAASAIFDRFTELMGGEVSPVAVLALAEGAMRACGLSAAKVAAIRDAAAKSAEGTVDYENLGGLADADVIAQLCQVRGVGTWTAQMHLIFHLRRPDVWPTGDYGVRAGYARAHGLDALPRPRELEALGEPYAGLRSAAAWYCWRAVSPMPAA